MLKRILIIVIILLIITVGGWVIGSMSGSGSDEGRKPAVTDDHGNEGGVEGGSHESESGNQNSEEVADTESLPDVATVVNNLTIPWDIAFLPEGGMLVTERPGDVLYINENGEIKRIAIQRTEHEGEGGLLGVVLHPDFAENRFVYLYLTAENESGSGLVNRVMRYRFESEELTEDRVIIDNIPGAKYHDGGRMEFGPPTACASGRADCKLYIVVGDATDANEAQDRSTLNGNILRLNSDGSIPADNPFPNSPVYSYGHRNPQGITWDSEGRLWSTEHGRSGVLSGMDEVNLIEAGKNYGWPNIEGDETEVGMETPEAHSGSSVTWAPASAVFWDGSVFFGGLRGAALYEAVLNGKQVSEVKTHLKNEYGRIRTVRLGPDGFFYLTTSNRDGRGSPASTDDRVIRINPRIFR